jgi:sugar phosphate isomerase/epimerase
VPAPVMSPQLACPDFTFPLLSHDHALDVIALLGFRGLDIGLFHNRGHLTPGSELRNPGRAGEKLRRRAAARGLRITDVFLIPGSSFGENAPNHPDPSVRRRARAQFDRALDYAVASGSRHITALPGIVWPEESRRQSLARSTEELAWRGDRARELGLTFAVEPHIGSLAASPAAAAQLVAATPGLTLTLDYGHFVRAGFSDAEVEPLVAHASHFHCRGGNRRQLQAAFDENTIDFARVVRAMRRTGYRGAITIEYVWSEWERCNEVDNLSETILMRDFLRSKGCR